MATGLMLIGSILVGTGIGLALDEPVVGVLIGTGVGFLFMGFFELPRRLMRMTKDIERGGR